MVVVSLTWIFNAASSLFNFETQKYYQNEPRFNGIYSGDSLTEIKDVAYIINLDESVNVGTHWIAFYVHNDNVYLILLV